MARSRSAAASRAPIATTGLCEDLTASDPLADEDPLADDDARVHAPSEVNSFQGCEAERRTLVVPPSALGNRLDFYLSSSIQECSRSHLKQLIEEGLVQVDGTVASNASRKVVPGQVVVLTLKPTAQSQAFLPEPIPLDIIYEDEHLLVVNKPVGLVVHPAAGNWTGTLMNGLLAHHPGAADLPRAGIVHRLDKDTSGLMVVGKTWLAVTSLSRAIAAREVSRQYLALVQGVVPESFTIESSIGRDPVTRIRMAVVPAGKPARTDVKRLLCGEWKAERSGSKPDTLTSSRTYSGVFCTLHTGRTHQIRVHLSSRRHPLVADNLYGGVPALGMTRQALHAAQLAFVHPVTGEKLHFEIPLPDDMAKAWRLLEASGENDARIADSGA